MFMVDFWTSFGANLTDFLDAVETFLTSIGASFGGGAST